VLELGDERHRHRRTLQDLELFVRTDELPQKLGRAKLGYGKPAYIQHFPQYDRPKT